MKLNQNNKIFPVDKKRKLLIHILQKLFDNIRMMPIHIIKYEIYVPMQVCKLYNTIYPILFIIDYIDYRCCCIRFCYFLIFFFFILFFFFNFYYYRLYELLIQACCGLFSAECRNWNLYSYIVYCIIFISFVTIVY